MTGLTEPATAAPNEPIGEGSTVREVLSAHPEAEAIFDRHGLLGCGGPNGPLEPIGFFARVHRVDPVELVAELNAFLERGARTAEGADGAAAGADAPAAGVDPARDLYPWFIGASLALALGAGLWLGLLALWQVSLRLDLGLDWTVLVEAHGHLQVVGFVTLFVAGVAFHVVPRFRSRPLPHRRLAVAALPLLALGALGRAAAQDGTRPALMAGATIAEALGVVAVALPLLVVLDAPIVAPRDRRVREAWEPWVLSGLCWLLVAGALDVAIGLRLAITGAPFTPTELLDPWLHASLLGFAASFTFGIGLRTMPVFMGLGAPSYPAAERARRLWTIGVAAGVGGPFLALVAGAAWGGLAAGGLLIGSIAELAGAIVAVAAIGLGRRSDLEGEPAGLPRQYEVFVRAAFGWLVVALGLDLLLATAALSSGSELSFTQVQAARHALALGFLTQLMLGFATRIVPVFRGRALRWTPLVWLGFACLNAGVLLRVVPEFVLGYDAEVSAPLAASGAFAFTGILAIAAALVRTYAARAADEASVETARESRPELPRAERPLAERLRSRGAAAFDPKLSVGTLLEAWPELLPLLLAEGFAPLANPVSRRVLAPRVSLEAGARLQGVNAGALADRLRGAIAKLDREPEEVARDEADVGAVPPLARDPSTGAAPAVTVAEAARERQREPEHAARGAHTPQGPAPLDPRRTLARAVLGGVYDPELGLDVVSLGLIREIRLDEAVAAVRMTLTTPGCPAGPSIVEDVREALGAVPGIESVTVSVDFDPPWDWSQMSAGARTALGVASS